MAEKKNNNKNNKDQYLIDYATELRRINNSIKKNITIPSANIDDVIKDPQAYAREFIEISFAKFIKGYKTSLKMGRELAKGLKDGEET